MPSEQNPIVAELWRGDGIESIHRGAWALVDTAGHVVDGAGDPYQLVYARSSTKSIQAIPLVELAAERFGATSAEIAVAISSHNGEPIHAEAAASLLTKAGLDASALACGPQRPAGTGVDARAERILNNCSGKHAGFLAATVALDADPAGYLDPDSPVQARVHEAMLALTGADPALVGRAIDGCSAPTYRLPLGALATGLARMTNPDDVDTGHTHACRRILAAARAHPELVGGTAVPRFDTDLLAVTEGRLFAKGGAEAVQTIGVVGAGLGFVAKIDDGGTRSLHRLALAVLAAHELVTEAELGELARWHDPIRRNRDGLEIGRHVIHPHARSVGA